MADALPGPGTGARVRAPTGTFTRSGNGRECQNRARGLPRPGATAPFPLPGMAPPDMAAGALRQYGGRGHDSALARGDERGLAGTRHANPAGAAG